MICYVGQKRFTSIMDAEKHIKQKHGQPGKEVKFVVVAAFGIVETSYLVNEDEGFDWKMHTPLNEDITYAPN